MTFKWNDGSFVRKLDQHLKLKMTKATIFLEGKVKQALSRGNVDGRNPSRPGEPPKVVTGALRASISHEVYRDTDGKLAGRVGTLKGPTSKYGARWEFGDLAQRRPFLTPTLDFYRNAIFKIIVS